MTKHIVIYLLLSGLKRQHLYWKYLFNFSKFKYVPVYLVYGKICVFII